MQKQRKRKTRRNRKCKIASTYKKIIKKKEEKKKLFV